MHANQRAERRNTMENNIYGVVYSPLDKEPLPEVGKTRLAEYEAIRPSYHMIWRSPQDLNPETCFD